MPGTHPLWSTVWKLLAAAGISLLAGIFSWGPALEQAEARMSQSEQDLLGGLLLLDFLLGVGALILVAFRRRAPLIIGTAVCLLGGLAGYAFGSLLLAIASLGALRRLPPLLLGLAATALGAMVSELLLRPRAGLPADDFPLPVLLAAVVALFLIPALLGWTAGARRALTESLRNEAAAAHAEREAAEAQARSEERSRIAREFHDEVGHRLSLIALRAGALEYREDIPPERVREEAGVIREGAHQAMSEVRSTLQLLRQEPPTDEHTETSPAEAEPSPDVGERLRAAAQEVTEAGSPVELITDADLDLLPASTGRHLYRIVQEGLTNALRHALGQPVRVEITGEPGQELGILVSNPLPVTPADLSPGSGLGLIGAAERARLAGGDPHCGRQLRLHCESVVAVADVRLLIVDDEELVRGGLRLLLDGAAGLSVVGEAADGHAALKQTAEHDPDVVLLDIRMPGMDGLTCAEQLLAANPERNILVLTTFDDSATVLRALEIGVSGFLLKDTPPPELIDGIQRAAASQPVLSPSVTRQVIERATQAKPDHHRDRARARLAGLTERERDIAVAVARGLSNHEIADSLYISLATVKTHVARILTKLDAENRVQASLCVYEAELM